MTTDEAPFSLGVRGQLHASATLLSLTPTGHGVTVKAWGRGMGLIVSHFTLCFCFSNASLVIRSSEPQDVCVFFRKTMSSMASKLK
jgi:hypothetical protein